MGFRDDVEEIIPAGAPVGTIGLTASVNALVGDLTLFPSIDFMSLLTIT